MTDDHHMIETLRDATEPQLAPGAASRIADGAWSRAATSPRRGPRFLGGPRVAWAAAAAVLVAVGVLALRGTDPAFAVDGDPVMVARGDRWVPESRVRLDDTVRVPDGGKRFLRWCDGGVLSPRPGSLFRFERTDAGLNQIRIAFERGGGEFDGTAFLVTAHDMVVGPGPSSAALKFTIELTADDGEARVAVDRGSALVTSLATSDSLVVNAAERATAMRVRLGGQLCLKLAKVADWTPAAGSQIATGRLAVVDANFSPEGGITLFGTTRARELVALDVPVPAIPDAVMRVNATARFAFPVALRAAPYAARYRYEKDGRRVDVVRRADGTMVVSEAGVDRDFADVAALRRDAPAVAALFGENLDK